MKITKRTKAISRTINLGNFNSIKLDNSAEAEVEEGDSLDDVDAALYNEIRRSAANDMRKIKEARKEVTEDPDKESRPQ
jgi:hypothetical protein